MMTYHNFWQQLTKIYETGEAKAIARYVFEHGFGLTLADILSGKDALLDTASQARLENLCQRLLAGEPVQYVTGIAEFGPLRLHVEPGVLIPRPETYELCQWIDSEKAETDSLLDIGTGSGCIAIALKSASPSLSVSAWDISDEALRIAAQNAKAAKVSVNFEKRDALNADGSAFNDQWDIIVSNPPYICRSEAIGMEPHVIGYEPHMALFVPDDDPLLFYRAIARYALHALKPGGLLYFEINPNYHPHQLSLLTAIGFSDIDSRHDQFGKMRFVRAVLQTDNHQ